MNTAMFRFSDHKRTFSPEGDERILHSAIRRWLQDRFGPVSSTMDWCPTWVGDLPSPSFYQVFDLRGYAPNLDGDVRKMLLGAVYNRRAVERVYSVQTELTRPDFQLVFASDNGLGDVELVDKMARWLDALGFEFAYFGDLFEGEFWANRFATGSRAGACRE